jgi:hypothetical protein
MDLMLTLIHVAWLRTGQELIPLFVAIDGAPED